MAQKKEAAEVEGGADARGSAEEQTSPSNEKPEIEEGDPAEAGQEEGTIGAEDVLFALSVQAQNEENFALDAEDLEEAMRSAGLGEMWEKAGEVDPDDLDGEEDDEDDDDDDDDDEDDAEGDVDGDEE